MTFNPELDRRNYALVVETLDLEHFLQISCGGEIKVTITAEIGEDSDVDSFLVFNGNGLDENDNDLTAKDAIKVFQVRLNVLEVWQEAVRFGYLHALSKMMADDRRAEKSFSVF